MKSYRLAVISDYHIHFSQEISPALDGHPRIKPPWGNGVKYAIHLIKELRHYEKLIEKGKIDRIVLLGDILDFITGEGTHLLYRAYSRVLEGEKEGEVLKDEFEKIGKDWLLDREKHWKHYRLAYRTFKLLVKELKRLTKEKKLVYIAGNHESKKYLRKIEIEYVDRLKAGDLYLEHGHYKDPLMSFLGWGESGPFSRFLKEGVPYRGSRKHRVGGFFRNLSRVYGYLTEKARGIADKIGLRRSELNILYGNSEKAVIGHVHDEIHLENVSTLGDYASYGPYLLEINGKTAKIVNPIKGRVFIKNGKVVGRKEGYVLRLKHWSSRKAEYLDFGPGFARELADLVRPGLRYEDGIKILEQKGFEVMNYKVYRENGRKYIEVEARYYPGYTFKAKIYRRRENGEPRTYVEFLDYGKGK